MGAVIHGQARGDQRTPVAALGEIGGIAQDLGHQGVEEARRLPLAEGPRRLGRKAEAGQGGDDQIEGVGRVAAVARGPRQLFDHVPELEMAARPAVRDQQRPLAGRLADHMDEVEIEIFHAGGELREAVEVGDGGPPVVAIPPIGAEVLEEGGVATVEPAVGNLRRRRPGIVAHAIEHGGDGGLVPRHVKGSDRGHRLVSSHATTLTD